MPGGSAHAVSKRAKLILCTLTLRVLERERAEKE